MLYFVQELIILGGQVWQFRLAGGRIWNRSLPGPRRQYACTGQKASAQNLPKDLSPRMQIRSVLVHAPVLNGYCLESARRNVFLLENRINHPNAADVLRMQNTSSSVALTL